MTGLDDPQVFITELFASHARYFPDRPAVVVGDVRRSWGEFDRNISRVANALLARGIGRGERVAVLMGNRADTLEVIFGIVRAGACAVPLSGLLTGTQLAGLITDSRACAVFATAEFRERLQPECHALSALPADRFIAVGDAAVGWVPLAEFLGEAADTPPAVQYRMTDPFNIIYSSGTTGLPKGIVQTHRARLHWAFSNAIEMGFTDAARALTTTSLYSNGTWLVMLPVLFAGGTLVAMPTFDAGRFLALVAQERITHSFMVPSQYQMVLAEPGLAAADCSSLRMLLCAGSPLRRDTKRAVVERFGNLLHEIYGFSEGFATMLKPGHPPEKFDTVGTPVLGFELRILDEAGRELPRGEVGEIAGYGAGMMAGYHDRPEQTEALIWRDERGRSFIRSGDIGRLDADGFLSIVDRKKDMIISGGFNVFPRDIEEIVAGHPAVLDVAVIGVPHEKWGETPLALMIPRADAAPPQPADLLAWANARLAKHQRLSAVELREAFPRNALGKVLKKDLRAPYWTGAGRTL
jgi:acyl-CoA synthetase (AMP-forming)/AMP-acid ligase II